VNVTVILCTYNRAQMLTETLESLAALVLPQPVCWEVLVVDNNSNDATREVVEGFCQRQTGFFRYVFEPRPGKSFALNTGIRESRGEVLAFLDDDVTVEPAWLRNLTAPLINGKWAGTGGRTLLPGPFEPPSWMAMSGPHGLGFVLAAFFDLGNDPCELDRPPYGANMAFRREMFEKYGLFRTDLGPSPNRDIPRPNEDTEFGRRLIAGGERLRYEPSAVVYHPVLSNRIRKNYFLEWFFDFGRAMVREWRHGPDVVGIPRRFFTFLKIAGTVLPSDGLLWMVAPNPRRRFYLKCRIWMHAGVLREIYREWRKKASRQLHPGQTRHAATPEERPRS
jgi:glycosyltransferase involved in cell wall biosynthesis